MNALRISILFSCVAAAATAGEGDRPQGDPLDKKVRVSFIGAPLDAACRFISESSGLKITCDQTLANNPVTATFEDTALGSVLKSVVQSAGGELVFVRKEGALIEATIVKKADGSKPVGTMSEAMIKEFEAKLDKKVIVDFKATPVTEALGFVQAVSELSMVLNGGKAKEAKTVTLKADRVPLRQVLDKILEAGELKREYRDGAICIGPKTPPTPPVEKDEKK